ncbi:SRPBCC family protein [Pseudochelatococcus sp. B33]
MMQIKNSFNVPLAPPETWDLLMDIPRIVPCMPGAELTEQVGEKAYKGKVSVKLGPVALAFAGTARFERIDEDNREAVVTAQGADTKGRGNASGQVHFSLQPSGAGTTVSVITDLTLTGAVAQYGRASGVIQGVATQLINEFAGALKKSLAQTDADPAGAEQVAQSPATPVRETPVAKPISGFSLILKVIWERMKRIWPQPRH